MGEAEAQEKPESKGGEGGKGVSHQAVAGEERPHPRSTLEGKPGVSCCIWCALREQNQGCFWVFSLPPWKDRPS